VLLNRCLRLVKVLSLCIMMLACLTGCWDRLEIEERAVILGIAVDEVSNNENNELSSEVTHLTSAFPKPKKRLVKVTVQIAVPGRIPLGTSESSGGGSGKKSPIWVLSAEGYTIDDALLVLQQQLADRMFFGHLRVIVISEKIARSGVQNLNDYLRRNTEVRRSAWMMVSKGPASDLMKAEPQLERVPTLYLLAMMENAVRMGKLPNVFLGVFWSADSSKGREPYLPYIELKQKGNMEILGLAYFRSDRMVGATKPLEIGVYMAVKGMKTGGYSVFENYLDTSETLMFKSTNRKSKTKVSMENGKPRIQLNIRIEGDIEEKSTEEFEVKSNKTLMQIQTQLNKSAEEAMKNLIDKMKKEGSDIFGFGEYIRAKEPQYWNREIKNEQQWQEMFKDLIVEVKIDMRIRRVGMKAT
jgi:spore germination protein KC